MAKGPRITARISPGAFRKVAQSLDHEIDKMNKFSRELAGTLAEKMASAAQENFDNAEYDGINDAEVYVNKDARNRYTVRAVGASVAFIEYGTGVFFNETYPGEVPARFEGRGEYGKGYGSREGWRFPYSPDVETTAGGTVYEGRSVIGGRNTENQIVRTARLKKRFQVSANPKSPLYYEKVGLREKDVGRVIQEHPIIVSGEKESPFYYKKVHTRARNIGRRLLATKGSGKKWVYTRGNKPNACMYNAFRKTVEKDFDKTVYEVKDAKL